MAFSIPFPEREWRLVAALAIIFLLTHLPFLCYMPLVKDEAIYAMMLEEQARNPTLVPTFLGNPVNWKPPLFFWAYAAFTRPLLSAPAIPLEAAYRLPSLAFSLLTIPVLFRTLRNIGASSALASLAMLIFIVSLPSINPSVSLLTDAMNFFFIALSLWLYTEPRLGPWRFVAAGALSFTAYFIKLAVAFMVPLLAILHAVLNDRRLLGNVLFLLSLISVPAAYVLNLQLLAAGGLKSDLYSSAFMNATPFMPHLEDMLTVIMGSSAVFLMGAGIWFALSVAGVVMHWRSENFMAAWYALTILPFLSGAFMVWYYLPVMPAVAYFAAMALLRWDGRDRADAFFMIFLAAALVISMAMILYDFQTSYEVYHGEKEAGLMLAGKENVAVVGYFAPTFVATKALTEMRADGRMLDFGWVVVPKKEGSGPVQEFAQDYHSELYDASPGDPNVYFSELYRKETNITVFDYIVVASSRPILLNGTVIYNQSSIVVYYMGADGAGSG
jgi:hypothetical protein